MKRKFFKFAAIALLLAGTVIACERKIDDQEASIIEKKIDGISFKFCLLNEQGEPATVFNEGENFSFYFSVTNCSKKDFYHNGYLILSDKKFLRVYGSSGFDFGKSYKPLPQTDIGIAAYPFDDGDVYTVKVPWIHEKDSVFCAGNF
ncbi:MAG: hypothetical protein LBG92_04015, partial [Prevotellaceae bacterium]|nr:hypothetical protein [Prevotellaceae bacterium]